MKPERFSAYVTELRDFSSMNKISCGHPHDLLTLPVSLNFSERFRYEFGSMIRSIVYREQEGISNSDLQALVARAWGGYQRWETPVELPPDLLDILYRVRTLSPGEPPPLPEEDLPEEEVAEPSPAPGMDDVAAEPGVDLAELLPDPSPDDYAQLLSERVKRTSGTHMAATTALATLDSESSKPRENPWQDGSWLHRKVQIFHATHTRRLLGDPIQPPS